MMMKPESGIFCQKWPVRRITCGHENQEEHRDSPFYVGQRVYVKPKNARCTSEWTIGEVTKMNSKWNIEVDGVPRHISQIRVMAEETETDSNCDGEIREINNRYTVRCPVILIDDNEEEEENAELSGSNICDNDAVECHVDNPMTDIDLSAATEASEESEGVTNILRKSSCNKKQPLWLTDFDVG